MPKRSRAVRFAEPTKEVDTNGDSPYPAQYENVVNSGSIEDHSLSLLNDPANTMSISPFNLSDELTEGVRLDEEGIIPKQLASLIDGGSQSEGSSSDDLQRIAPRVHTRNSNSDQSYSTDSDESDVDDDKGEIDKVIDSGEEDQDDEDHVDNARRVLQEGEVLQMENLMNKTPEGLKSQDSEVIGQDRSDTEGPLLKRIRADHVTVDVMAEDGVGFLAQEVQVGETLGLALERIRMSQQSDKAMALKRIENACALLRKHYNGELENADRGAILKIFSQWELCWGDQPSGKPYGPFDVDAFLEWARARYFVQPKIAWVRPVGGLKWWRAVDIFRL